MRPRAMTPLKLTLPVVVTLVLGMLGMLGAVAYAQVGGGFRPFLVDG